jgi:DNA-binding CsgD family transcriptional regulator/ligand-binding sensor domain-containing protein
LISEFCNTAKLLVCFFFTTAFLLHLFKYTTQAQKNRIFTLELPFFFLSRIICSFLLLLCSKVQLLQAQVMNLGLPPVYNFSKENYHAGPQFWDLQLDARGVAWMGNSSGLLSFDGVNWQLHPLENQTIVRSVGVGNEHQIYVGGQGIFGYFLPDEQGQLDFINLSNQLPASEQQFADVWDIELTPRGVFFRTDHQVFRFFEGKMTSMFPAGTGLFFMGRWGEELVVQLSDFSLWSLVGDRFQPMQQPAAFSSGRLSGIHSWAGDTLLLTTIRDGIFSYAKGAFHPWKTADDDFLKRHTIFCSRVLPDGKIAIGTALNGFVLLDRSRRFYYHFNKKNGLRNNTVLCMAINTEGQIWLGLDNGTALVDVPSPITYLYPDGELQGAGYTARKYGDKLYFGMNTGLYALDWKSYYRPEERTRFRPIENASGQVWSLTELEGRLLMGHHDGAFEVEGWSARKLSGLPGIWQFQSVGEGKAIAGHYNGFASFKKEHGHWEFGAVLKGFKESSRLLTVDGSGRFWMAHPYRGVYQIQLDWEREEIKSRFWGGENGLPSNVGNHLYRVNDQVVVTAKKGLFFPDSSGSRMVSFPDLDRYLDKNASFNYLYQDPYGAIWFRTQDSFGVLRVLDKGLEKQVERFSLPMLFGKLNDGFPFVYTVDEKNVFIAAAQGFIHFNPVAFFSQKKKIHLLLHEITASGTSDSLLFGGATWRDSTQFTVPKGYNSLTFAFGVPSKVGSNQIQFSYYLEGKDPTWSKWDPSPVLTFNSLRAGDYRLNVKAKAIGGAESNVMTFQFTVLPPWYNTFWAYCLYVLLGAGLLGVYVRRQKRRFEREKAQLHSRHALREAEHLLRVQQSEEAINRLQKEKLEAEVTHKSLELASATMHLVQKNEILNTISTALGKLKLRVQQQPELEREVGRILKMVEVDANFDADWEHFSRNFDHVHSDFLKRLGERFGHLSPNEYKLCAYLRMNLSSKEIASLMNISVRGVEASRYRLRKRLGLDTETNLTDFLIRF